MCEKDRINFLRTISSLSTTIRFSYDSKKYKFKYDDNMFVFYELHENKWIETDTCNGDYKTLIKSMKNKIEMIRSKDEITREIIGRYGR